MLIVELALVFVLGAAIAAYITIAHARKGLADDNDSALAQASASLEEARSEAKAARSTAISLAKSEALAEAEKAAAELATREAGLETRDAALRARLGETDALIAEIEERDADINRRFEEAKQRRSRAREIFREVKAQRSERVSRLAAASGLDPDSVADSIAAGWLDDARSAAAHAIRAIEQAGQDASVLAEANRYLEISSGRYQNHFLTERAISTLKLSEETAAFLTADGGKAGEIVQALANVKFNYAETGDSLRLEGLDGVGREVARRAVSRLNKKPEHLAKAKANPEAWVASIKTTLEREIVGLGKKAFTILEISRPHPEIVELVGRLNYRTSYTQNQWLHAVEAAFLASMIGDEMGLDRKLLRRATLMHDIGKALTHEIEGSHAVIGADIARRLGEDEIVANAIGSHHADEPPNSVYAFLVAGCDAMSGARPGARREHTEGYSSRLSDMERIGCRWKGVDRAFAVHGGRELRVYVEDDVVSDLDAVEMSREIAATISAEMTFPGQIKVTVIRATEAISVAS